MPHLRVNTNIAKELFDEAFIQQLSSSVAKVMGKSEEAILFSLSANEVFYFCGTFDPAASVHLSAIDPLCEEKNSSCATAIFDALEKIGIPKNRVDIIFYQEEKTNVAMNGKLFSQWNV